MRSEIFVPLSFEDATLPDRSTGTVKSTWYTIDVCLSAYTDNGHTHHKLLQASPLVLFNR